MQKTCREAGYLYAADTRLTAVSRQCTGFHVTVNPSQKPIHIRERQLARPFGRQQDRIWRTLINSSWPVTKFNIIAAVELLKSESHKLPTIVLAVVRPARMQ